MKNCTIANMGDDFAVFDGENIEEYHGEEMADFFSTYFLNDAKNDTAIIWIYHLSVYIEDILHVLHVIGYHDVAMYMPAVSDMKSHDYQYLISDDGTAYRIIVKTGHKTTYIYNVDNLLSNISDKEIIKDFGTDIHGGKLEKLVKGAYKACFMLKGFQAKRTPFTLSMYALRDWKATEELYFCDKLVNARTIYIGKNGDIKLSDYLRKSYHGGWCYYNTRIDEQEIRRQGGLVYDVNSLYPYIMKTRPMPWGMPTYYDGEIPADIINDKYKYYFIHIICKFELKEGDHFPFISKKDSMYYWGREYLETSDIITRDGQRVSSVISRAGERTPVKCELVLSKTDYEMMQRHYDITDIEYIDGVAFGTCRHAFDSFIDKHYEGKKAASVAGDKGKRHIEKIVMNSVSGGLAKRAQRSNLIINYDESDNVMYDIKDNIIDSTSYIYLASAILSYAREYVIEYACVYASRLIYSDTDSLHLLGKESADLLKKDPERLGFWKLEKTFDDAMYFKRKTYVHQTGGLYKITFAGMDKLGREITENAMARADFNNDVFAIAVDHEKYRDNLSEEARDCIVFDEDSPERISYQRMVETLMTRADISDDYDPMWQLQYTEYPVVYEWSENFCLHQGVKWCKIKKK